MSFIVSVARIAHWFLLPFLVIWMAIAPDEMLPNCLTEAKAYIADKFRGSYFGNHEN